MAKTGSSPDLYDILGVAKDASAQDIKKAFRVLARECHPDVAGNDPKMAEKFVKVREAYEVLSDPAERARYDRRGERRASPFYGSMWNRGNVNVGAPPPPATGGRAANDLDLEDIFNDFGVGDFGFTGTTRGQPAPPRGGPAQGAAGQGAPGQGTTNQRGGRVKPPPPPETGRFTGRSGGEASGGASARGPSVTSGFGFGAGRDASEPSGSSAGGNSAGGASHFRGARRPGPVPGRDIPLAVDVPLDVAARGGTVTVTYTRLRRADDGHTLYRYDELHDLKVPPGVRHGETLRVPSMGDAGLEGGRYGELVVDVRVVGGRARSVDQRGGAWDPDEEGGERGPGAGRAAADEPEARRDPGRMKMPSRDDAAADGTVRVDVGLVIALLGGRVPVETPGGTVRVNIPAGTSSGTRMRLRGRGLPGADGALTDLVAEVRIVVPKGLDEESRRLIERFAELNPSEE
ncbi:MAG: DnaJ domain-containing protein [Pseudomonadota bacterium]|nr:DnaJ domain-containing protein [Pseudomonadota bacterium]